MSSTSFRDAIRLWAQDCGILEFAASTKAIGGALKSSAEDFRVNELTSKGKNEVTWVDGSSPDSADESREIAAMRDVTVEDASEPSGIIRFTLQKERMDTLGAIGELAARLNVPVRSFGFAGLKDFRAITTQELTLHGCTAERMRAAVATQLGGLRLRICDIRPATRGLKLGECAGNRFRIVIRRCINKPKRIRKALRALKRGGFVNYYGLQRFGDPGNGNDELGMRLLRGEYVEAVASALRPMDPRATLPASARARSSGNGDGDGGDVVRAAYERKVESSEIEAREAWTCAGDARTALKLMPKRRVVERSLLKRLADPPPRPEGGEEGEEGAEGEQVDAYEATCRSAVLGLPFKLRRLLAHAYFSRLWNLAASERLRRHGTAPAVEGELVIPPGLPRAARGAPGRRRQHVHRVTAAEAASATFDARCVVIPLPGADVLYPETPDGVLYKQRLFHDGIDPEAPGIEASAGRACDDNWFSLQGDYRHLLQRPKRMRWEILEEEVSAHEAEGRPQASVRSHLDVAVQFDLGPGAYATMALREVMDPRSSHARPPHHIRF